MKLRFLVLTVALLMGLPAWSAGESNVVSNGSRSAPAEKRVLKYLVGFSPEIESEGAKSIMNSALALAIAAAPKNMTLLPGNQTGFEFVVNVTTSGKMQNEIDTANFQGRNLDTLTNAYTVVMKEAPRGPFIVTILWDRVAYELRNGKWHERPDMFIRLVNVLVHEIYGNVVSFQDREKLLTDPAHRYSEKYVLLDQAFFEVLAYRAGIEAMRRLISEFEGKLPEKMMADLRNAIRSDSLMLDRWTETEARLRSERIAAEAAETRDSFSASKSMTPATSGTVVAIGSIGGARCEALFRPAN